MQMFRKQNYMQLVACVSKRETGGKCVSSSTCVQVIACLPKREARGQMCVKQHLLAYGCLHVKKGKQGGKCVLSNTCVQVVAGI